MSNSKIFIIQGRQKADQVEIFLNSLGLEVLSWPEVHALAVEDGIPTPNTWDIVRKGIDCADVVVGLLTPDDEVRLSDSLHRVGEQAFDIQPMGQARPNVLIEIGYALGTRPEKTLLIQIGKNRPMTDLIGHYITEVSSSVDSRRQFIGGLKGAGCQINDSDLRWQTAGDFTIDALEPKSTYNRFQGNYRGDWQIVNYQALYQALRSEYETFVRQAALRGQRITLHPQIPQGGSVTAAVLFDGRIVANLIHGEKVGVMSGLINDQGGLEGTSQYPGEEELAISGSIRRLATGQINVQVVQNQPNLPENMSINAVLNRF